MDCKGNPKSLKIEDIEGFRNLKNAKRFAIDIGELIQNNICGRDLLYFSYLFVNLIRIFESGSSCHSNIGPLNMFSNNR
jgi:hypothetical protein